MIVGIECGSGMFEWFYLQTELEELTIFNQGVIDLGDLELTKMLWVLGHNLDQGTNLFFENMATIALRGSSYFVKNSAKNNKLSERQNLSLHYKQSSC